MFMRELYGQQWLKLQYNIMRKELFKKAISKLSSIKWKAFEIGGNVIGV
jgi:hypothetical protein